MTILPFPTTTKPPASRIFVCTGCGTNMLRPPSGACPKVCRDCQVIANIPRIDAITRARWCAYTRSRNHAGVQIWPPGAAAHQQRPVGATPAPRSTDDETEPLYGWLVSLLLSSAIAVVWLTFAVLR